MGERDEREGKTMTTGNNQLVDEFSLIKKGETCVQVGLSRGLKNTGLIISARAHSRVESFFEELAPPETPTGDARVGGRNWHPVGSSTTLRAYQFLPDGGLDRAFPLPEGGRTRLAYRLNRLGQPLLELDPSSGMEVVNLSFLRLVGISSAEGVTFSTRGVYGESSIRKLAEAIREASKSFYINFLKPIGVMVMVSTQDLPPEIR